MKYTPHTNTDIKDMLECIGVKSIDDLFNVIPDDVRLKNLPEFEGFDEYKLLNHIEKIADKNKLNTKDWTIFLGAGRYYHFIPEVVNFITARSEFSTCYTPYQPEVSQGTLQAIYEYQTLICKIFGMEVANASMYDGASALAEAILMSIRITGKNKIALPTAINPLYRKVVTTYLKPLETEIIYLPYSNDGVTYYNSIRNIKDLAAIVIQSPNFFGCIESLEELSQICKSQKCLSIVSFTEALAYGLINPPGLYDIDIVCGEAQSFGLPPSYGGPSLGIFTTKMQYVRSMPGRLVGQSVDKDGKRGFVLTLATREQHIRREKATSNICTNENLCAIVACIYLTYLGKNGLFSISKLIYDKKEYLKNSLKDIGINTYFNAPTFNEFVIKAPPDFLEIYKQLTNKNILAGLPLKGYYPELNNTYLLTVTEILSKQQIDRFVDEVKNAL
jgi:glycine dehydrogenase subunit 1